MFHPTFETRWQAFGAHLLISLLLFIAMCTIIVVFWYPGVLFTTEGGWQGVRLIAGIDFVIGPVLTLLVYKKGKKSLKFDLTVIGVLQAVCITYGMYVVHYSRPAVVAYADGVFYTTPLLRFESRGIEIYESPYLKEKLPAWVNIKLPENQEKRLRVKLERLGAGLETSIDLYEPYTTALPLLAKEGYSLEEAIQAGVMHEKDTNAPLTNLRVFRLITRYHHYAVSVDVQTGKFVDVLMVLKDDQRKMIPLT